MLKKPEIRPKPSAREAINEACSGFNTAAESMRKSNAILKETVKQMQVNTKMIGAIPYLICNSSAKATPPSVWRVGMDIRT